MAHFSVVVGFGVSRTIFKDFAAIGTLSPASANWTTVRSFYLFNCLCPIP
jgi:hypothetical protein